MPLELKWRGGIAYVCGTIDGKRIRRSLKTSDPAIAATRKAQEETRLYRAAIYGVENEATFADACVQYLKHQAPKRHYLTPIIRRIGKQRLAQLTGGQVRILAKELYPDGKPQTRNRQVLAPISAVINFAHELGMCPPIRIKRFASRDRKIKIAIDRAWIDRFRRHAVTPYVAAYALFIHTTAARSTEAMMLRPEDLNLEQRHGWSRTITKTGNRRQFWLTEEMAQELRQLPPKQIRWGKHKGEWRIFGWADCKGPIEPWKETCRRAGLKYVTPYEAGRHSFATEGITRQDRNPVMVAKIGNWQDTRTLLDNYAHPENMGSFAEEVYGRKIGTKLAQRVRKNLKIIDKSK
jgi:integrase